jgi:hypothetical protein
MGIARKARGFVGLEIPPHVPTVSGGKPYHIRILEIPGDPRTRAHCPRAVLLHQYVPGIERNDLELPADRRDSCARSVQGYPCVWARSKAIDPLTGNTTEPAEMIPAHESQAAIICVPQSAFASIYRADMLTSQGANHSHFSATLRVDHYQLQRIVLGKARVIARTHQHASSGASR